LGLLLAVAGPALALGGVWPWVIPAFASVIAALLLALHRRGQALRIPVGLGLGLLAAGATLAQLLPIPGLRAALAPELHAWVEHARVGIDERGWPGLSPTPVDTAFELVRLLALAGLVLVAAQLRWRTTARALVVAGASVAAIGLVQHGLGVERIYGLYEARHLPDGRDGAVLLATFINPNHQSGLLLVTGFATAGLLVAPSRGDRLEPRIVLGIALFVQGAALVLSSSRAASCSAVVAGLLGLVVVGWPARALGGLHRSGRWIAALAVVVGIAVGVASVVAWDELVVLLDAQALDPSTAARLRVTTSATALVGLAPVTGIGRGAFGDVFPAFDPEPSHVWFSHLECAPLAMIVEWGPLVGGALAVLLPAWWLHAMRHAGRHDDARARRVALLGLFAIAVQGLADFSLDFLGVAAPACALAGALSAPRRATLGARRLRGLAIGLAGLAVAITPLLPATWAWLRPPASSSAAAIAARPLHAPLQRLGAREALATGDLHVAELRARAAVRLQPGNVDGWLLLAAVAGARGDEQAERRATLDALGRLHRVASAELVRHLVSRFPAPDGLATLAPAADEPWEHLVAGLLAHAPAHADAVAAARARRDPGDLRPLRHRFEAALVLDSPALALHHARLWRGLDPRDPHAHLAVARALQAHAQPRTAALREALELALQALEPGDAALRGLVEEQLLRALLRPGAPVPRERLRELARALRGRPADDATRRRRLALVEPILADRAR
jgi:hypothetical protein